MLSYRLIVRRGPQPDQVFDIVKDVTTLGRHITNDIVINDPEVSLRHLRFSRIIHGIMCEDLGSTNGTFIGGKRLVSSIELKNNDNISLGETVTLSFVAVKTTDSYSQSITFSSPIASGEIEQFLASTISTISPIPEIGSLKIFISYRKTNRNRVDQIAKTLENMGHNIAFDKDIMEGQKWWDVIIEQIQKADLIIAMLSPDYLDSEPCHLEYTYATNLRKRILPVQIDPVNYRRIPVELQKIQMVQYIEQNNQTIRALKSALSLLPPAVPMPEDMPEIPDAPIPEISKLKDEIINITIRIGVDRQKLIAIRLYEIILQDSQHDDANMARELLGYMLKRDDTSYMIGQMIEKWLKPDANDSWWNLWKRK